MLNKESESIEKTTYCLYLQAISEYYSIVCFVVSGSGYPIRAASSESAIMIGSYEAVLKSREDIQAYLAKAASTPDSRLVLRIASVLKLKKQAGEENSR